MALNLFHYFFIFYRTDIFCFVGNMYVGIATIFVVTCMAVYLHKREYSETN
ncbi:hypothetical protein GLOIN_2v1542545, partial [Rhizophagus irregularis DAOM 181602=DAOM 197198]